MRLAIISDIHGNFEAFKSVLESIEQQNVDDIISLGDNIGYGPEPEAVVDLLRQRQITSIKGNHELAVSCEQYFHQLNSTAQKSINITKQNISKATVDFSRNLSKNFSMPGVLFVHGRPPSSVAEYLFSPSVSLLRKVFSRFEENICFFGHTHVLELFCKEGQNITHRKLERGVVKFSNQKRYLVNVGSVGQPRDGSNNAKYIIWDEAERTIEVMYIPYNIKITADKILALGMPEFNAKRLW